MIRMSGFRTKLVVNNCNDDLFSERIGLKGFDYHNMVNDRYSCLPTWVDVDGKVDNVLRNETFTGQYVKLSDVIINSRNVSIDESELSFHVTWRDPSMVGQSMSSFMLGSKDFQIDAVLGDQIQLFENSTYDNFSVDPNTDWYNKSWDSFNDLVLFVNPHLQIAECNVNCMDEQLDVNSAKKRLTIPTLIIEGDCVQCSAEKEFLDQRNEFKGILSSNVIMSLTKTNLSVDVVTQILRIIGSNEFSEIDPVILKEIIKEQSSYKVALSALVRTTIINYMNGVNEETHQYNDADDGYWVPCDSVLYHRLCCEHDDIVVDDSSMSISIHDIMRIIVYPYVNRISNNEFNSYSEFIGYINSYVLSDANDDVNNYINLAMKQIDVEFVDSSANEIMNGLESYVDEIIAGSDITNLSFSNVANAFQSKLNDVLNALRSDKAEYVTNGCGYDADLISLVIDKISSDAAYTSSLISDYVNSYKDGSCNFDFSTTKFLTLASQVKDPTSLIKTNYDAVEMSKLGWSSNSLYTQASSIELATGIIDADGLWSAGVIAAKAMGKAATWLGSKIRTFVNDTLVDGLSLKICHSGFNAIDTPAVSKLYTFEQFNAEYPNLFNVIYYSQGFNSSNFCVTQIGNVYVFMQTVGSIVIVSMTPKIDRKYDCQLLSGNDYLIIDQIADSLSKSVNNTNAILQLLKDNNVISESWFNQLKMETMTKEELMRSIISKAEPIKRVEAIAEVGFWVGLGVLAGAILCISGLGTVAGVAVIAACTGVAVACSSPIPNQDMTATERLIDDEVYANSIISSYDYISIMQNAMSDEQLVVNLILLDALSNVNMMMTNEGDFVSGCLVHNGNGLTLPQLNENDIELGFIPMLTLTGAPSFRYHIITDNERLIKFSIGAAVVGTVLISAATTFIRGTLRKYRIKRLNNINAALWSGNLDDKQVKSLVNKASKIERKLGVSNVTTNGLLSMISGNADDNILKSVNEMQYLLSEIEINDALTSALEDDSVKSFLTNLGAPISAAAVLLLLLTILKGNNDTLKDIKNKQDESSNINPDLNTGHYSPNAGYKD